MKGLTLPEQRLYDQIPQCHKGIADLVVFLHQKGIRAVFPVHGKQPAILISGKENLYPSEHHYDEFGELAVGKHNVEDIATNIMFRWTKISCFKKDRNTGRTGRRMRYRPVTIKQSFKNILRCKDITGLGFIGSEPFELNGISGYLTVIDIDNLDYYKEVRASIPVKPYMVIATGRAGGGRHLYYITDKPINPFDIRKGIEVRGIRRYVVTPGSLHLATGNTYEIIEENEPEVCPSELIKNPAPIEKEVVIEDKLPNAIYENGANYIFTNYDVALDSIRNRAYNTRSELEQMAICDLARSGKNEDEIYKICQSSFPHYARWHDLDERQKRNDIKKGVDYVRHKKIRSELHNTQNYLRWLARQAAADRKMNTALKVLKVIIERFGERSIFFLSSRLLALYAGISIRTAAQCLAILQAMGVLRLFEGYDKRNPTARAPRFTLSIPLNRTMLFRKESFPIHQKFDYNKPSSSRGDRTTWHPLSKFINNRERLASWYSEKGKHLSKSQKKQIRYSKVEEYFDNLYAKLERDLTGVAVPESLFVKENAQLPTTRDRSCTHLFPYLFNSKHEKGLPKPLEIVFRMLPDGLTMTKKQFATYSHRSIQVVRKYARQLKQYGLGFVEEFGAKPIEWTEELREMAQKLYDEVKQKHDIMRSAFIKSLNARNGTTAQYSQSMSKNVPKGVFESREKYDNGYKWDKVKMEFYLP